MSLFDIKLENRTILQGQVLENLSKLPSGFFNCIVTSPPYYDVRDYAEDGQWGKEKDPAMYLEHLRQLMSSLWRVLKSDGVAWINIGDCIIDESWYGFPEFFFANCRRAGWISVTKPIWFKRNAMPLSTPKRLSPKYEPFYGFAKSKDWYFNLDNVRVPVLTKVTKKFNLRVREGKKGKLSAKYGKKYKASEAEKLNHNKLGEKKQDQVGRGHYTGFNGRYDHEKVSKLGKNPGDVLDITVKPIKTLKHYAYFPTELPEFCISATCPENGWVLDPFMGSGTTAIAAERLGRKWVGIELKESYINESKKRIGI